MPVTWAHTIVAFPLKKRFPALNLPALIIGNMGPDIEMFIPFLTIPRELTHSFSSGVITALPLTVLVLLFYELVLKRLVLYSLPWQIDVPQTTYRPISVLLSLILGIVLHMSWDIFTHEHTIIYNSFPIFGKVLFSFAGFDMGVYKFLQYGSSALGSLLIVWIALKAYLNAIPKGTKAEWHRLIPVASAVIIAVLVTPMITGLPHEPTLKALYPILKSMLTTGTAAFFIVLFTATGIVQRREKELFER